MNLKRLPLAAGILLGLASLVRILYRRSLQSEREYADWLRRTAERDLLLECPFGSPLVDVAIFLKRRGFTSTWKLKDDTLTATKPVRQSLSLASGPHQWDLKIDCRFNEEGLTSIRTNIWSNGL